MNINFLPLNNNHFPLLLKWLETPHVKKFWDTDIKWTKELIEKKYKQYVNGYKILKLENQVIKKPIHAFIIEVENNPIGYIQYYNKHDFPSEYGYNSYELPKSCASLDLYIGEVDFLDKGIGSKSLEKMVKEYVFAKFDYAFLDPETSNIAAIKAYSKAGFKIIKQVNNGLITWMIKEKIN